MRRREIVLICWELGGRCWSFLSVLARSKHYHIIPSTSRTQQNPHASPTLAPRERPLVVCAKWISRGVCLVWTAFRREEKAPSVQISIKTIIDDATTAGNQRSGHQQKRINKSKNRHHQQIKTNVGKVCVCVCEFVWVDECAKKEPINGFTYKLQIIQFLPFITHSTAPLIYHGNSLSKSLSTPPHIAYGYDAWDAIKARGTAPPTTNNKYQLCVWSNMGEVQRCTPQIIIYFLLCGEARQYSTRNVHCRLICLIHLSQNNN